MKLELPLAAGATASLPAERRPQTLPNGLGSSAMAALFAKTLSSRLEEAKGRPSGFDYMRLVLAVSVILFHTVLTCYGQAAQDRLLLSRAGTPFQFVVPMFFALSGFLVAGSFERSRTLLSFLGLRFLRIFPALTVEVTLSAIVLGSILTVLPLRQYVSSPEFFSYFRNVIGDIHYFLPGVFSYNPAHQVNSQLWTVPYELRCYIALSVLAFAGVVRWRWCLLMALVGFQAFLSVRALVEPKTFTGGLSGNLLVFCFLIGLCLYRFRDKAPWSRNLAAGSALLAAGVLLLPNGRYFAPIPMAYLTVYLGLLNPRRIKLLLGGDYSYGLYLYGFPVQQAVATFEPLRIWWLSLAVSLPCAIIFAGVSWHCIEKHVLALRKPLFRLEDRLVRVLERVPKLSAFTKPITMPGSASGS